MRFSSYLLAAALAATVSAQAAFAADNVIDQWSQVKAPATPPELKPATVDVASTALLVLDFNGANDPTKGPCNAKANPRCIASIPAVKALLDRAREKGVYVVYSTGPTGTPADIATDLAPKPSDPVVKSSANKYVNTDLDKLLTAKSIKTVIVTGTAADGAVMQTASEAIAHGLNVILPVDGMSAGDIYSEQYTAWYFTHAPNVPGKTVLTRSDLIKF